MKKVSKAKCSHLGLDVFLLSPPYGNEAVAFLPAHVRDPDVDTEKNDAVLVGTAPLVRDFLLSRGMDLGQIKDMMPKLQSALDHIPLIEFVERRIKRHTAEPNPDPALAAEDAEILSALKNSTGSFVTFDEYVAESKTKRHRPSRKPA